MPRSCHVISFRWASARGEDAKGASVSRFAFHIEA